MKKSKQGRLQVLFICPACGRPLAWALPTAIISCPCGQWVDDKNRRREKGEVYLPVDSEQTVLF